MAESNARTYRGWQHEQALFLLGLTGRRAAVMTAAIVLALQPIAAGRIADAVAAWPLAGMLAAVGWLRVAGRTVDEWAVQAVSFGLLRARGRNRYLGGVFAPREDPAAPPEMDLPGILAPLRLLDGDSGSGGPLAVIHHPQENTYTAVAQIATPGIGLVDSTRRDQRVDSWGGLLAGLCTEDNPIIRVQVLQRAVPEHAAPLRQWHHEHVDLSAPLASLGVVETLLTSAAPSASQRQAWLAVTLDAGRAALAIRGAGGGEVGACAVLARHVRTLTPLLASADLTVTSWLSPREWAEVLRTAFDPDSAASLARRRAAGANGQPHALESGVEPALAAPAAAESGWGRYRHDGGISISYAIHGWPLTPVYSTVLAPLLAESPYRRAVSFYYEPLGPRDAERQVMRERTKREVTVRLRQRTGQAIPEHEKVQLARAQEQDSDRAAGHGLVRFTGYLVTTVASPREVEDACAELESAASAAGVELRRMWGAQDIGFALGALPVGLGLPKRRW